MASTDRNIGELVFKAVTAIPGVHRVISNAVIYRYAKGTVPGRWTTEGNGTASLHETINPKYFSLEVPKPTPDYIKALPPIDELLPLFEREGEAPEIRASLLLPFFAQHLTDAVFQSDVKEPYKTNAPHEIILNQVYGNTAQDSQLLRSHQEGKLKTQTREVNGRQVEFPDALCENIDGEWQVKQEYRGLSYLDEDHIKQLMTAYEGKEQDICATGLFQGNMTLGNFAITSLLVREHNRLCDGIMEELKRKGKLADDDTVFEIAQQNNITAYMKVVIEDYINTFAGQDIFRMDTKTFGYRSKDWCTRSPIPYHFNILYRFHSMLPDQLRGFEGLGFNAFLANNDMVMGAGLAAIFEAASNQAASAISLKNTPKGVLPADRAGLTKARGVLASFNTHREAQKKGSSVGFDAFDPRVRKDLERIYKGDPNKVDYAVGILAERPRPSWPDSLGLKQAPFIGDTLMNDVAKHAFRHILSNPFMARERLNPEVLTDFGWDNLHQTSSVAQLVARNVPEHPQAAALDISFQAPHVR